jgi:5'-3' exonuclease
MTAAPQTDDRRVVLIDLSSIYWASWHATAEQGLSEAAKLTMNGIRRCYNDGDLVAICCDSGRSFRRDISADYKANRPEKDQNALGELARLKERLVKDGFLLWAADGFEADDIIATAVVASKPHQVLICSADKDLLQLLGPGVRVLRTHAWIEGGVDDLKAKYGITPEQMVDYLALVGDSSDNIKGAPGIGPKTAAELLNAHGSIDGIYRAIKAGQRVTTPARMSALIDNVAQVVLAGDLVKLRTDAPINWSDIYAERKPARLTQEEPDMDSDEIPISRPVVAQMQEAAAQVPESAQMSGTKLGTTADVAPLGVGQAKELAIVPVEVEYHRALEPRSFEQALKCARYLYESRLYAKFSSPDAIAAVIMRGREMGFGAATSLDVFHCIDGKVVPYAYLIIALAEQSPDCEYIYCVEQSATSATWETKNRRNPKPSLCTFTLEQARAADLAVAGKKNGWAKNPEDMLVKSAGAKLARRVYRRETLGLVSIEEMGIE